MSTHQILILLRKRRAALLPTRFLGVQRGQKLNGSTDLLFDSRQIRFDALGLSDEFGIFVLVGFDVLLEAGDCIGEAFAMVGLSLGVVFKALQFRTQRVDLMENVRVEDLTSNPFQQRTARSRCSVDLKTVCISIRAHLIFEEKVELLARIICFLRKIWDSYDKGRSFGIFPGNPDF